MNNKLPRKLNALKHGLLAKQVIIESDQVRSFNKLNRKLIEELNPTNALEMILAEQVVLNYWRLRRFLKLENELVMFAGEETYVSEDPRIIVNLVNFIKKNPSFDVLTRYNATILKSFYRSLQEYQNIKMLSNANHFDKNNVID